MKVSDAIADILRREGVETIIGYPVNHILERGAAAGIRPIIVRQERTGLHMADAMSRVTSGRQMGVFVMQHGPGTENAYGGVAQAWSEFGADPRDAGRLCAPARLGRAQLQFQRPDARHHQVGRAGHVGQGTVRDHAPRVHAAALRARRAGAGRGAERRVERGGRSVRLRACRGRCAPAPIRTRSAKPRRCCSPPSARCSTPARACTGRKRGAS